MEISQSAEAPELDLYTIPSYSNWFQWNTIHEIERLSLREFFDGTSVTRTPRIYKEYRDFIITKYRELPPPIDPYSKKRVLNFTDVRKSLVGDVSVLQKVFTFLEKWGLINFEYDSENEGESGNGGEKTAPLKEEVEEEVGKERVRVEEGAPYGVRVVAAPNSLKPVIPMPPLVEGMGQKTGGLRSGSFAGLGSYTDVYGGLLEGKGVECGSCKEMCGSGGSGFYECTKEDRSYIICEKCFKEGKYGENKGADDFKLVDSSSLQAVWSEAEISLLLESVLKHGDDWEAVVESIKTKSKRECISKLLHLPFGDLMIGSVRRRESNGDATLVQQGDDTAPTGTLECLKTEDKDHKLNENQQNGDAETEDPPKKKQRSTPSPGASSLLKQVSHICGVVGPHITASAGEAAISALCFENQCPRELFDDDDDNDDAEAVKESEPSSLNNTEQQSAQPADNSDSVKILSETESKSASPHKNVIPQTLRTRAATATALGAAAAHAKILADQEEREMEQLIATIIESQLKKMHEKGKYLAELEQMMDSQHKQMEEVEESLILERIDLLRRLFNAGLSRSKDLLAEPQPAGTT
ncbi:hypothetical protein Leryth_003790 [Lithospermum erythrorhizon]|nr:hypothetical protein Leryth_003790 [Lithospermum erythrorhizon]